MLSSVERSFIVLMLVLLPAEGIKDNNSFGTGNVHGGVCPNFEGITGEMNHQHHPGRPLTVASLSADKHPYSRSNRSIYLCKSNIALEASS